MIWQGIQVMLSTVSLHIVITIPFGIRFTSVVDLNNLMFLDLELTPDVNKDIKTKTLFKPTSGSSYLHKKVVIFPRGIRICPSANLSS